MKKIKLIITTLVILTFVTSLFLGCEKNVAEDEDQDFNPSDTTEPIHIIGKLDVKAKDDTVVNITETSADIKGYFVEINEKIKIYGHCYSYTDSFPIVGRGNTDLGSSPEIGVFTSKLTNLLPGTEYFVRSFVITDDNRDGYSPNILIFRTKGETDRNFIVKTGTIENISQNGATANGHIGDMMSQEIIQHGHCYSSTAQTPTVFDNATELGKFNGKGEFTSTFSGLAANTTYYVRAYASTNENGGTFYYGETITFTTEQGQNGGGDESLTDIEGNAYKTVDIGTQTWMAENLKATKFNDGTALKFIESLPDGQSIYAGEAVYMYLNNDYQTYGKTFGCLYNDITINEKNICPTGWHIPTGEDWYTLIDYLGGEDIAGGKLKKEGTVYWNSPNTDATNESGFSAIEGGFIYFMENYDIQSGIIYGFSNNFKRENTSFWAVQDFTGARYFCLESTSGKIKVNEPFPTSFYASNFTGSYIRCIKD